MTPVYTSSLEELLFLIRLIVYKYMNTNKFTEFDELIKDLSTIFVESLHI
jgi:hypothetical protein